MKTDSNPYLSLKFSLQDFERLPHELDNEQLVRVQEKSREEERLHTLILDCPEAAQVVVDDQIVLQAMQVIADRYDDQEEFENDLEENELNQEKLYHALRNELRVESVLELIGRNASPIREEIIQDYYLTHQREFTQPEQRRVRQILITVDENGAEENRRAHALARLSGLKEKLLDKALSFKEAASIHSECPSALSGGLLGTLPRSTLYPELDSTLFSLAENEMSEIIETELGFHLLFCEEIQAAKTLSLEEAEPALRKNLQDKRAQEHIRKWLVELSS